MTIIIREFRSGDEIGICEAHVRSVREICSQDYSPEQIDKWVGHREPKSYVEAIRDRGERFWVIDDNGKIGGFGSWVNEEIMGFYLHPEYTGRGLARRLFEAIEKDYREKSGNKICKIVSTLTAKEFYEHMGFTAVKLYDRNFQKGGMCKVWDMVKTYT
jgi:putative acetyltransferase